MGSDRRIVQLKIKPIKERYISPGNLLSKVSHYSLFYIYHL